MTWTRRELGQLALGAVPAGLLWPGGTPNLVQGPKPNSRFAGVQIGMNTPYNFGTGNVVAADELLKLVVEAGASALELRAQPIELFMGSPALVAQLAAARAGGGGGRGGGRQGGATAAPPAEAAPVRPHHRRALLAGPAGRAAAEGVALSSHPSNRPRSEQPPRRSRSGVCRQAPPRFASSVGCTRMPVSRSTS